MEFYEDDNKSVRSVIALGPRKLTDAELNDIYADYAVIFVVSGFDRDMLESHSCFLLQIPFLLYIMGSTNKNKERIAMYTIYVKFECLPQKREAFIQKVKDTGILDAIRAENGCIRYDYYLSEKDSNELLLIEQWESKNHQQVHIEQPHMAKLREFKGDYITNTFLGEIELK